MNLLLNWDVSFPNEELIIKTGLDNDDLQPIVAISDPRGFKAGSFFKLKIHDWFKFINTPFFKKLKESTNQPLPEGDVNDGPDYSNHRVDSIGDYKLISDDSSIRVLNSCYKPIIIVHKIQFEKLKEILFHLISYRLIHLQSYQILSIA